MYLSFRSNLWLIVPDYHWPFQELQSRCRNNKKALIDVKTDKIARYYFINIGRNIKGFFSILPLWIEGIHFVMANVIFSQFKNSFLELFLQYPLEWFVRNLSRAKRGIFKRLQNTKIFSNCIANKLKINVRKSLYMI